MFALMTERYERLREARIKAGYRYASDAANALGITASTYRAHENGQNDFGIEEGAAYAKKFGVDLTWLMGVTPKPQSFNFAMSLEEEASMARFQTSEKIDANAWLQGPITGDGRLIPVYGRAVGGVDGEFEMNGSKLYDVMAPPVLSSVSKAYGVIVSGDSMSPRYEDGEVCFVDPSRRVKKGDYVIAQIRNERTPAPLAYVKRFVKWNSEELVLEQFNPQKELRFKTIDVVSVHYIALAGNA